MCSQVMVTTIESKDIKTTTGATSFFLKVNITVNF